MTRVQMLGWVVVSNHAHLIVADTHRERPRLMGLLNTELAQAGSARIGRWDEFREPGIGPRSSGLLGADNKRKRLRVQCSSIRPDHNLDRSVAGKAGPGDLLNVVDAVEP